jgi:cytosine permease
VTEEAEKKEVKGVESSEKGESKFDDYSLMEVPKNQRYGFFNMFLVFGSVYGAIAVIWAGGALGYGLTFTQATLAVLAGTAVLTIL